MKHILHYKSKANACKELAKYLQKLGHYAKAYSPKESEENGWGYKWACYSDAGGDDWTCGVTALSPDSPLKIDLSNKYWWTAGYSYSVLLFEKQGNNVLFKKKENK